MPLVPLNSWSSQNWKAAEKVSVLYAGSPFDSNAAHMTVLGMGLLYDQRVSELQVDFKTNATF